MRLLLLALAVAVILNVLTPDPVLTLHTRYHHCRIHLYSYEVLEKAKRLQLAASRPAVFDHLSPAERRRCWVLCRLVYEVFRYAPERTVYLERAIIAFSEDIQPAKRKPRKPRHLTRIS